MLGNQKLSHVTRRQFLKISTGVAVGGAVSIILPSCTGTHVNQILLPSPPAIQPELLPTQTASLFNVLLNTTTRLLWPGQQVAISGRVVNASQQPLRNENLGVHDGLALMSRALRTDKDGNFSYSTVVNSRGASTVEFIVRGSKIPFIYQVAFSSGNILRAHPLNISSIAIQNNSRRDVSARIKVDGGPQYVCRVPRGRIQTILQTVQREAMKRVTVYGGGTFVVGAGAGGNVAVTVDNQGVGTVSVTGGAAFIRGSVYATSQQKLGACWAPGGDFGLGPVSLSGEIALCAGSDGINVGASGSLGGATAGFSINIIEL